MLKTKDGQLIALEQFTWKDIIEKLVIINPKFAAIIEDLVADNADYTFYKANYQFGNKIISNEKCYLPLSNGDSIAFNDPQLPDSLRNDLSYNNDTEDPLGLILSKNCEFYLPGLDRIQPYSIMHPGQMFGIPRAINNTSNIPASTLGLSVNAGARSLFMLSKISDQNYHSKIQEHYGTKLSAPTSLKEHWALFVDIAKQSNCPWRCEIIYFSRKWIDKLKTSKWSELANYLMQLHRASYNIWHNSSVIWNKTFHDIEQEKHLTNYPMQSLATAKQMFFLAANSAPGFRPATNNDAAPISLLQEAYTTVYNKLSQQKNSAVIMEPATFNLQNSDPIYYSLNYPTFTQTSLEVSKKKSQIALLEEIRWIIEVYSKAILSSKRNIKSLYEVTNVTTFSYYHTNPENYKNILDAILLAKEDPRFTKGQSDTFPLASPFFKGCIKISRKI